MTLQEKIYTFSELSKDLRQLSNEDLQQLVWQAQANNYWFSPENVELALNTIIHYLNPESLTKWLSGYNLSAVKSGKVGVVMAGNVPAEGFHDCMCVLLSGHTLLAKVSSSDDVILKKLFRLLVEINPEFEERIILADRLNDIDALIAKVSDKSVGQFNRYFSHIPSLIRSSRKSCAILNGNETAAELKLLGNDILHYFGLGNRNVAKLYVPEGYSFNRFFESIEPWHHIAQHHRYVNNYDYNKSILLINQQEHQDNGFLLVHESRQLLSPVAVLYYAVYKDSDELSQKIAANQHQLQNIVSQNGWYPESIPFGQTTKPALGDYIGNIDTMQFLVSVN